VFDFWTQAQPANHRHAQLLPLGTAAMDGAAGLGDVSGLNALLKNADVNDATDADDDADDDLSNEFDDDAAVVYGKPIPACCRLLFLPYAYNVRKTVSFPMNVWHCAGADVSSTVSFLGA
jgi:hypothetical protein